MSTPTPGARVRLQVLSVLASALPAFLAGCAGEKTNTPRWIRLAQGFEPRPLAAQVALWERSAGGSSETVATPQHPGFLLTHRVAETDWRASDGPGHFALTLPRGALAACGVTPRLSGRGREFPRAQEGAEPAPGEIRLEGRRLFLRLAAEVLQAPQTTLVLATPGSPPREIALRSADWRPGELAGSFWIEAPAGLALEAPEAVRLFAPLRRRDEPGALAPYEYRIESGKLVLRWPEGAPPSLELVARLENGREMDGNWQLRVGNLCANGIPVWSGTREEIQTEVPPRSRLAFQFVHAARPSAAGSVHARVLLDDQVLLDRAFEAGAWSQATPFVVPLPAGGRPAARLTFEVEGTPGLGAFLAPVIGPAELPAPAAHVPPRADIVLFLVDTFRADSLEAYGGEPDLAPQLNRFAQQSLVLSEARASAAWTLPSIATLLTGLFPGQHGATDENLSLPAAHVTVVERLERAGYRTGAITDGSFFSPVFGLDQGFEWFLQHEPAEWDLDRTIAAARAFLERDDGRPVFLVVHTYRVHQPYRAGPDEDRAAYDACMATAEGEIAREAAAPRARLAVLARHEEELRALYHEGVRDLDRGFGLLLATLEEARFFEHGTLVVTSDHGESLGENQDFFHGGHLWETKLEVPLLLRGPGILPRRVPYLAGPIDLAPTLAELAGIAPDPAWAGTSLLALDHERPAFAFQLSVRSRQVACRAGSRKLILTPEAERLAQGLCEEAFDLAEDPGEARNLAGQEDWPGELTRRLSAAIQEALEPRGPAERAGVPAELRADLDALGYGGASE